jgi:hypothetical protein
MNIETLFDSRAVSLLQRRLRLVRYIDENRLPELYSDLYQFLDEEFCSERILLYFPIELIPEKGHFEDFRSIYRRKWYDLLSQHDIRANFTDGDIPEEECRVEPLEMVVKAAHLIPALVRKNIITETEVQELLIQSSDPVLHSSLRAAKPVKVTHKTPERIAWESKKVSERKADIIFEDPAHVSEELAQVIKDDAVLSKYLYPLVILYGSKVKGYRTTSSDTDFAVFVKPGTKFELRPHIQRLIDSQLVQPLRIEGKALEFWVEEDQTVLRIKDFKNPDRILGDSLLTHVLFGGVWGGDKSLSKRILLPYLHSNDWDKRRIWLSEIERDTLQYRLMHRGYHSLYPEQWTELQPEEMMDRKGAFWDAGYRRLATKLFLKKVFLPHV